MKTAQHSLRPIGLAVAIACGSLVAVADVAPVLVLGETITVTGTTDGAGTCSGTAPTISCTTLRSAVDYAKNNGNHVDDKYDRIVLTNNETYTLTSADGSDAEAIDALDNSVGDLDIDTPMNIETTDPAGQRATIEGGSGFNDRLLQINAAVKLDNLVLTNGQGIHMNGGAIYAGDAGNTTINNSVITGNKATWDGDEGDLDIDENTLNKGTTEVQGSGGGIYSKGVLTINKSTLSNNIAQNYDTDTAVKVGNGGAIYASQATSIVDSTIGGTVEPAADGTSAGTQFGNQAINGAGIQMAGGNSLEVLRSTLSFNYAVSGGGLNVVSPKAPPTITNSTISSNHVTDAGGGINTNAALSLFNTTIANNKMDSGNKGAGVNAIGGIITLKNTLLAGNMGDADETPVSANCGSTGAGGLSVQTQGGNLSTDSTCNLTFSSDQQNVADAKLGPLALNDNKLSDTFTHALLEGSPAIDKAINDGCPATDQRGFVRPFDIVTVGTKVCDVGAYEAWVDRNDVAIASMTVAPTAVNLNEAVSLAVQVANNDDGTAGNVALKVTLPTGVTYVSGSSGCAVAGSVVTCTIGAMPTMTTQNLSMELKMGAAGTQTLQAQVTSDLDATDLLPDNNQASVSVTVTDPNAVVTDGSDGGGCSAATGERPVDPVLPLLAGLGLFGWALRRLRRS